MTNETVERSADAQHQKRDPRLSTDKMAKILEGIRGVLDDSVLLEDSLADAVLCSEEDYIQVVLEIQSQLKVDEMPDALIERWGREMKSTSLATMVDEASQLS